MNYILFGAVATALMVFAISTIQSILGSKVGSDHPAHLFLITAIRHNGNRLFARIPRILNTCYCGAIPLYIHWMLSYFNTRRIYWAERLLNPTMNALNVGILTVIVFVASSGEDKVVQYIFFSGCVFALTPQFYHALSARNFGLSSRGIGLLLLTLFLFVAYYIDENPEQPLLWIALTVIGWLIWGFSTFTQQAVCIIGLILLLTTGRYAPIVGTLLGLGVFILINRKYSVSYLKYTYKFLHAYATELAPIYIIPRRPSIWGDLVWGIWVQFRSGLLKGGLYAYGNSFLIVFFLNPLVLLACWLGLTNRVTSGLISYAASVALAGTIAALLTSFRQTRFLGEPERYAEAITPWAVLCGTYFIYSSWGIDALIAVVVVYAVATLSQLWATHILVNKVRGSQIDFDKIATYITHHLGDDVRFCSNNEQLTKMFMKNSWRFAFYWVVGQDYCGMRATEAFTTFPWLKRGACERIASTYMINICLLDRKLYDTIFDIKPSNLRRMTVAYETDELRAILLEWEPVAAQSKPLATE
jgi:hypothetical protein